MKPSFRISFEVEVFFVNSMNTPPEKNMEPALVWCSKTLVYDKEFYGVFMLGYYYKGQKPRDSFFDICGHQVSILPSTLEKLNGKTLIRETHEIIYNNETKIIYLLRAS